jgi:outer membrane protein TolC
VRAQDTLVLTLNEALSYATEHNKTLVNSSYAIEKSSLKIKETFAQGLPQVSATLDYSNFLGAEAELKLSDMAPPAVIEFNPTSSFNLSVSQLIFSGSYYVGLELSKLSKTITEQSYQKDELNVKEQTTQAYYMVLASEQILNTMRENRKNMQTIYEKTTNLVNAGMIEETEAKKLSVMITSVDNAIKQTERQVALGYNLLLLQLGFEENKILKLATSFSEIAQQNIVPAMATETFSIDNNLDYQLLTMQSNIAQQQIRLRQANYLPTLAAYFSYTEKLIKPAFDMTPKNVLGLKLTIPIFSSGMRMNQVQQARIDYQISQNTIDLLAEQISTQERQLRYNYNNLLEQYYNQQTNVEIAKEVLEKMNFKFQQGIVSSLELTSANNEYLTAETNYTSILLQLLNAELSLRKINNKL